MSFSNFLFSIKSDVLENIENRKLENDNNNNFILRQKTFVIFGVDIYL